MWLFKQPQKLRLYNYILRTTAICSKQPLFCVVVRDQFVVTTTTCASTPHSQEYVPSAGVTVVQLVVEGLLAADPSGQRDLLPRVAERPVGTHQ